MNNHDHDEKHRCECEHTRVKFCKRCQVIHCLGCAKEWGQPYNVSWYYNNPYAGSAGITYTSPQYIYTAGTTTLTGTSKLLSNTTTATSAPMVSKLCDHGEQ